MTKTKLLIVSGILSGLLGLENIVSTPIISAQTQREHAENLARYIGNCNRNLDRIKEELERDNLFSIQPALGMVKFHCIEGLDEKDFYRNYDKEQDPHDMMKYVKKMKSYFEELNTEFWNKFK
ncbi:hypothetical protein HYX17_00990 [Candidatus Woesearchaeota archaeon]|nr:hypothetical protein [Candidatus Woesearchaeota archaeon]